MFARLGLRALNLVMLFFAMLGFFFVPLGERTAWEHSRAVLDTPAASEACREVGLAARRLGDAVLTAFREGRSGPPNARIGAAPTPYAVPMFTVPHSAPSGPSD